MGMMFKMALINVPGTALWAMKDHFDRRRGFTMQADHAAIGKHSERARPVAGASLPRHGTNMTN